MDMRPPLEVSSALVSQVDRNRYSIPTSVLDFKENDWPGFIIVQGLMRQGMGTVFARPPHVPMNAETVTYTVGSLELLVVNDLRVEYIRYIKDPLDPRD